MPPLDYNPNSRFPYPGVRHTIPDDLVNQLPYVPTRVALQQSWPECERVFMGWIIEVSAHAMSDGMRYPEAETWAIDQLLRLRDAKARLPPVEMQHYIANWYFENMSSLPGHQVPNASRMEGAPHRQSDSGSESSTSSTSV